MSASPVEELRAVAAALAAANTTADAVATLFDHVLGVLGAASGALWLIDHDAGVLRWAGGAGIEASVPAAFQAIPLDAPVPGPEVARSGAAVSYSSPDERDRRWPALKGTPTRVQAVIALPVQANGVTLGVLGVGFPDAREFPLSDRTFLGAVADQVAYALERSRLLEAEREGRNILEFLADATRALSATLDPDEVLRELCRLAVPRLGDWAGLYVVRHGELVRIEQAIDGHDELARRLVDRFPVEISASTPVAEAFRSQQLQKVPAVTAQMVAAAHPDSEFAELTALLADRPGLAVPIVSPNAKETMAVLTLSFTSPGRSYSTQLTATIEDVAGRAGLALDTANRYQRERRTATTLTQAVLPPVDLNRDDVEVGARYVPVDIHAGDVGGDWFDAWELEDGRLVVGIGDVAGHGLDAATTMAMLRHAARTVALDDPSPTVILGKLNRLLATHQTAVEFATSVYALIDVTAGTVEWSSAGHPPPVIAGPGGAGPAKGAPDPPLGVNLDCRFSGHRAHLNPGGMMVLTTDGVIESRGSSVDEGLGRLADAASTLRGEPDLEAVCDLLIQNCIADRDRSDDCCVVVVRRRLDG